MNKKCIYICNESRRGKLLYQQALGIYDISVVEGNESLESILEQVKKQNIEFAFFDDEFYEKLKPLCEKIPYLIFSYNDIDLKTEKNFIFYPCSFYELEKKVNESIERFGEHDAYADILGTSSAISEVKAFIKKACKFDFPVVISGETGTGKNLIAKAIHTLSHRKHKRFLEVNVTTVPHTLCESIFFGVSKGAFTGALDKTGLFEEADGGTVFLDEIENMDLQMQGKLLSVIEQKKFSRLGEHSERMSDFRLITATNESLEDKVSQKSFRQDLYYRLNILPFYIKPLRERKEDIPLIAQKHVAAYNKTLSEVACEKLQNHVWYGNVRELKNCLTRAVAISDSDTIGDSDILFSKLMNSF